MRLAHTLCTNGFSVSVAIYGNKYDRKHAMLKDLRIAADIKVVQIHGVEPDVIARQAAGTAQAVVFDGVDTEALYSRSFHMYAKHMPKILDVFQLGGTLSQRKQAFEEGCSLGDIAKVKPSIEVGMYLVE